MAPQSASHIRVSLFPQVLVQELEEHQVRTPFGKGWGGLRRNWRKGKVGQGPRAGARREPSSWTLWAVVTWGEPGSFSEGADNVGVLTHCLLFLREAFFQNFLPFGLSPTPHPGTAGRQ